MTNAFQPYDAPGDALEHITNMKMGNNTIEDHTARFRTLLEKSGVPKNSPLAIDYYQKTLNVPLQKRILELPVMPKRLDEWYEWAMRLDNNYHNMMRLWDEVLKERNLITMKKVDVHTKISERHGCRCHEDRRKK